MLCIWLELLKVIFLIFPITELSIKLSVLISATASPPLSFLPKWNVAIFILLSAKIFERLLTNPGLSSLLIYKLCLRSSASILIPFIENYSRFISK